MAQSITRQMKRGHLVPVFNPITGRTDFYKRLRNSGLFSITVNPYNNTPATGSEHLTVDQVANRKNQGLKDYIEIMTQKQKEEKPGFIKRLFGKKTAKKTEFPKAETNTFPSLNN